MAFPLVSESWNMTDHHLILFKFSEKLLLNGVCVCVHVLLS